MYPVMNEESRRSYDSPASGLPNAPIQSYPPPPPPPHHTYSSYFSTTHQPSVAAGKWSTGLCHCCDDPANCIITCFCPCITFGQIAEIVDKGSSKCAGNGAVYGILLAISGHACLYSCFYRSKLRGQYDLEEAPCVDCLVHFCCETCALCQEYRELKNRGFDMGIGWEANMDRQKRGVTMAPVAVPSMSRI